MRKIDTLKKNYEFKIDNSYTSRVSEIFGVILKSLGLEVKFVDEDEANRRAKLCLNCKNNIKNYGHSFAHYYTDKMMARSVGDRRVRDWQNLFTCKCCSCILNSKVWFSGKIVGGSLLRRDLEELKQSKDYAGKPFKCWQVEAQEELQKSKGDK